MKFNRVTALLLSLVLAFSLAACGQGASSASSASSSSAASSAAAETKTEEQLLAEENEILSANDALWEKVFASMDKNMTETTLSTNYGDFLRSSVEKTKDQFSDEEYKTLPPPPMQKKSVPSRSRLPPLPSRTRPLPALPHRALPSPSLRAAI